MESNFTEAEFTQLMRSARIQQRLCGGLHDSSMATWWLGYQRGLGHRYHGEEADATLLSSGTIEAKGYRVGYRLTPKHL